MSYNEPYYFFIAAAFIIVANVMAFAALRLHFVSTRKSYLPLACAAIVLEMLRQVPDFLLADNPLSRPNLIASSSLQFSASAMFLAALLQTRGSLRQKDKTLLAILIFGYLASAVWMSIIEVENSSSIWYMSSMPILLTTAAIVWTAWRLTPQATSGRNLLLLSSLSLFAVRAWIPSITLNQDLLYLVYYMEVLLFPMMAMALTITEVEATQRKVQNLLAEQTQSKQDLQFILDNSLDITLIANNVGLLLSWNKRAQGVFGYEAHQVIGKFHIDELFSGNYWHKNATEFSEFEAVMENIDGATFPVKARMQTVHKGEETYSIYVIKEDTDTGGDTEVKEASLKGVGAL